MDAVFTNLPIRNPTSMSVEHLIEYLRLPARVASTMDAHGAGALLQIQHAAAMIAAGLCHVAVCVGARDDRSRRGRPRRSSLLMGTEDEADLYGAGSPPVQYALAARRHMHEYGTTSRQFGAVAVAMRRHAALNPNAQMRETMSLDDHQSSPRVADPLRLLDCCQVSDAGGAVVVVSAERARALRRRPVLLRDEPTNHLDFETVEALAQALAEYSGTIFFVSHDRTFVSLVASNIVEVGEGRVVLYPDTYEAYVYRMEREAAVREEVERVRRKKSRPGRQPGKGGAGYQQRKQLRSGLGRLESRCRKLEGQMKEFKEELEGIHREYEEKPLDYSPRRQGREKELQVELAELEHQWLDAQAEIEKIKGELG